MRGLKARAKMADVHEIRGASVTARGSAPVRRGSPFRWLPPTHPRERASEPSRRGHAPRRRIVQDRQPPLHPHLLTDRTAALLPSPWKSSSARRSSPASQRQKVHSFGTRVVRVSPRAYLTSPPPPAPCRVRRASGEPVDPECPVGQGSARPTARWTEDLGDSVK